ncbi:MAG: hypothetical protein KAH04_07405 [Psychrilyobacter sp.]|nr:hypothetical protein [Psychrilyobacter sp.]
MWFENLVGFQEKSPEQVRENIEIVHDRLISKINKREFMFGQLEMPTLEELRDKGNLLEDGQTQIKISEVVGNIQSLHTETSNNRSLIQVASQFNLLEMVSPNKVPEEGIGIYEFDRTQGPACAIACGAGTIYRNYFVDTNGKLGQTSRNQIDCLEGIGLELENDKYNHWKMKNGYALATKEGLESINNRLKQLSKSEYEYLKGKLKIGIQWDSEVTISDNNNLITQVYCSALPIAYSMEKEELWSEFAKLILEATYESTFYAALKNYEKTKNNKVFLTLIGGGAFGNKEKWILNAIKKSIIKFKNSPLDIKIVSYGASNKGVKEFIKSINNLLIL